MERVRNKKGDIKVKLNIPQMAAITCNFFYKIKKIFLEFGRGTGKSTILAWFILQCVRQMPRSTGILVGSTYVQILSRTLPSTKEGLEMFGIYENVDYVVGKCGAALGFELPFQSPSSWRNIIHFRNGTIMSMVSLDMENAGRGINSYWVIGDEAALLDKHRLFINVQTTNRAKKSFFKNSTLLNAEIFASSTPLSKMGKWFVDMEEVSRKNSTKYAFLKANAYANAMNLSKDWFDRMRDESPSDLYYNAEILNIRPPGVLDGFYARLDPLVHYYGNSYNMDYLNNIGADYSRKHYNCKQDNDLVRTARLQLNLDFGKRINSITVSQYRKSINEVRFLKEFFNKHPKDMLDLLPEFVEYYDNHECKVVELYHDTSGFQKEKNAKDTLIDKVSKYLRSQGWKVINKTPKTNNPAHLAKFLVINELLSERDPRLPKIRINKDNCPNLCISLENAEVKIKENSEYGKDKSSEVSETILQEHATHLSDTFDYNLFWQFCDLVKNPDRTVYDLPIGV